MFSITVIELVKWSTLGEKIRNYKHKINAAQKKDGSNIRKYVPSGYSMERNLHDCFQIFFEFVHNYLESFVHMFFFSRYFFICNTVHTHSPITQINEKTSPLHRRHVTLSLHVQFPVCSSPVSFLFSIYLQFNLLLIFFHAVVYFICMIAVNFLLHKWITI